MPKNDPAHTIEAGSAIDLETAVWRTLAYVDGFEYPLTAQEIHRYLEKKVISVAHLETFLQAASFPQTDGFYSLPNREPIVHTRLRRQQRANQLWPPAISYAGWIAKLPFVRMIAVTGSLAMNNVTADADVDYLIVTENGRLWLTRALIIGIVRLAARRGIILCPNYLLSLDNLYFQEQNLYTAHELSQMVPLFGIDIYWQMRHLNQWTLTYLPNANDLPPTPTPHPPRSPSRLQTWCEFPLRTALGNKLEHWEMKRKIRKLKTAVPQDSDAKFTTNQCKGHFDTHQQRTIRSYQLKTKTLINE